MVSVGLIHGCVAVLWGVWGNSTSWWEHVVKVGAHLLAARKKRKNMGQEPSMFLWSQLHYALPGQDEVTSFLWATPPEVSTLY